MIPRFGAGQSSAVDTCPPGVCRALDRCGVASATCHLLVKQKRKEGLLKMSQLSRLCGVSPATIKHYIREGLLTQAVRTHPNMAYYDPELVPRIKAIKELQRTRFLPLRVIKEMLDHPELQASDETTADVIGRVLSVSAQPGSRTRAEILAAGYPASELDFLKARGLCAPEGEGPAERYSGDDLALVQTLADARRAGIDPEMLPLETLDIYAAGIKEIVRRELEMFRAGVLPRAGERLPALAEAAATLSERLVLLLRRKLLLPTLSELMGSPAPAHPAPRAPARPASTRKASRR